MDAGNLLKPMLARGELHCIGATTLDEYRQHIEKDAALERRFQPVFVDQPIGRGHDLDPPRPARSGTRSTTASASRTRPWSPRRCCRTATSPTASCRTRRSTWSTRPRPSCAPRSTRMPAELDEVNRRVMQLEIEREALKKETDAASQRPAREAGEGAGRPRRPRPTRSRPAGRPRSRPCSRSATCASRSSRRSSQIEQAERQYDLNRAAELKYGKLPELEQQAQGAGGGDRPAGDGARGCSRRRWARRTSPRSSAAGPACR